ncbi:MAG TPA: XylR family transcriptional regulator [Chthoniobacteraceae bacterium]|nr:XylR family transcriptional regulator [Verrucomicrobiae bacterium]HWB60568.1 XylR family transcriptional regulator [Chthoniobacteraceae bacterium]
MKKPTHIGLLVDASRAYGRGIYRGVANFAETREHWIVLAHERPELDELPGWLKKSRLDALIAYIPNRKLRRKIDALGVPAVDVHGRCRGASIPVIESDDGMIVRLAFEFFLQSGFRHLAYCGYPGVFFSDQREEAVRQQALELKDVHIYEPSGHKRVGEDLYRFEKSVTAHNAHFSKWLRSLPKPVAILAGNDILGQQVINACREARIRMPEEIAVLGIDNDEIICRLCRPTLSSIEPDVEKIGFLAAQLIADQLDGKRVAPYHLVPPRQVVQRKSTDTVVADHPAVVHAARLIRDKSFSKASVEEICQSAGVSRSTLDKLFLAYLGRTIAGEITRIRLQRSRNLLRNSNLSLSEIAGRCGFASSTYFCRFFKRCTAQTPDSYRRS